MLTRPPGWQGGKDQEEDDEHVQDRYRVISFDGTELPLEEAFADSAAADALSHVDGNGAEQSNVRVDAVEQEQKAVLAGELG